VTGHPAPARTCSVCNWGQTPFIGG
jgi:hypothetical protein